MSINPDPLCLIAGRAVANAESFCRFEKDGPATLKDARFDLVALGAVGSQSRLFQVSRMLVQATQLAAAESHDAEASLVLVGLTQWVRKEQWIATRAAQEVESA